MNRALRGLLACALGAGILVGPAAVQGSAKNCGAQLAPQASGETLYLDIAADKYRYRRGQVVYVTARVSRTPFDSGLPIVPVWDAGVLVHLDVQDDFLYGAGTTDVRGGVTIPIRIKRGTPAGVADASGSASVRVGDVHCLVVVEETGGVSINSFLRILDK